MRGAAHTEFSRVLAEHGLLGLTGLILLLSAAMQNLKRAPTAKAKAMVAAMMAWSLFFMLISAMRLVAPSLTFGLTFANLIAERQIQVRRRVPPRIRIPVRVHSRASA
jgi:hypothetical protein